ncbi:uncharacterized protein J3R85_020359 [Psidium guajava]|nr:uncharacterized protein J3R85_020359 [Psidium guajava]
MSCSLAVANSPVFSPSRVISSSLFCNKASLLSSSPEALSLSLTHLKPSPPPSSSPSSSSPSSPFRFRLQKPPTGLSNSSFSSSASNPVSISGSDASPTILKRKRPARLDIPVAAPSFGVPATPAADTVAEEIEEYGYSVYCKRGRREAMEDRYSASVAIRGDSKQVNFSVFGFCFFLITMTGRDGL